MCSAMKTQRITINLNERDYEQLETHATEERLPPSALARSLLVKKLKEIRGGSDE